MKIRIKDNSIRFRLAQDEVTCFVNSGEVFSKSELGGETLIYGLKKSNNSEIECSYNTNRIIVTVPTPLLTNWDTDERVGFRHTTQEGLFILIEKDWQCMKPRINEDESNLYVNPQA